MKTLFEIQAEISGAEVVGDGNVTVSGITHDSRSVRSGYLFAALKGEHVDGARFAHGAVESGAAAILCDSRIDIDVPQLIVPDARDRLGEVAAACYDHPGAQLKLLGITGTNGKTTITWLVETILREWQMPCGVMGTIEYRFESQKWHADHTTPEATVVQSIMRSMVDAGAKALAMEVSSHGIALGRLNGCPFDVVAFTNLTQDHLDFHHSMSEYGEQKLRLFTEMISHRPDVQIVLNGDDPFSARIRSKASHPILSVSTRVGATATLHPVSAPTYRIDGTSAIIQTPDGQVALESRLCGAHNLSNQLVAFGICRALGVPDQVVVSALARILAVPGRLERVPCGEEVSVFVDYAHTPDALENVLSVLRPLTRGRLMCVFGCGGDRDGSKRPLMGEAVARHADITVITSDNPRTEDPDKIIDMVIPGVLKHQQNRLDEIASAGEKKGYVVIPDRRTAIEAVILSAVAGDTVLLAGKGHEDYVIVGKEKRHFDDREEAAKALSRRQR